MLVAVGDRLSVGVFVRVAVSVGVDAEVRVGVVVGVAVRLGVRVGGFVAVGVDGVRVIVRVALGGGGSVGSGNLTRHWAMDGSTQLSTVSSGWNVPSN